MSNELDPSSDRDVPDNDSVIRERLDNTDKPVRWHKTPERRALQGADGVKRKRQMAFLAEYANTARVSASAKAAGINPSTHRRWLDTDAWYRERFLEADEAFGDKLKAEIERRALEGVDKPVIYKGVITDTYKEFSDNLLMFYTKAKLPEFKDKVEVSGKDGGPIQTTSPLDALLSRIETIAERDPIDITPVADAAIDVKKETEPRKQLPPGTEGDEAINPDLVDG